MHAQKARSGLAERELSTKNGKRREFSPLDGKKAEIYVLKLKKWFEGYKGES